MTQLLQLQDQPQGKLIDKFILFYLAMHCNHNNYKDV